MPTLLARVQVTVTPDLAAALATARTLWPDLPASQQVVSLATAGAAYLADRHELRYQALQETQGILQDAYPPGYLDDLRQDWQW